MLHIYLRLNVTLVVNKLSAINTSILAVFWLSPPDNLSHHSDLFASIFYRFRLVRAYCNTPQSVDGKTSFVEKSNVEALKIPYTYLTFSVNA